MKKVPECYRAREFGLPVVNGKLAAGLLKK